MKEYLSLLLGVLFGLLFGLGSYSVPAQAIEDGWHC
jgi:hypothetical protein